MLETSPDRSREVHDTSCSSVTDGSRQTGRIMFFNEQRKGRTTLFLLPFLEFVLCVVLVLTLWASICGSLSSCCLLNHTSGSIQTARGHNRTPVFVISRVWEEEFLTPSMSWSTMSAFDLVCQLHRDCRLETAELHKSRVANCMRRICLDLSLHEPPEFWLLALGLLDHWNVCCNMVWLVMLSDDKNLVVGTTMQVKKKTARHPGWTSVQSGLLEIRQVVRCEV